MKMFSRIKLTQMMCLLLLSSRQFAAGVDIIFSPGTGVTEIYTDNFSILSPPVNFTKNGLGTTVMRPSDNVGAGIVSGSTTINQGIMELDRTSPSANGNRTLPNGTIDINSGATLRVLKPNQIGDATTTTIDAGTLTFNASEYLATITMKNNATINGSGAFVLNGTSNAGLVATGGGNAGTVSATFAMASDYTDGTTASSPRTGNGTTPITVDANTFVTISGVMTTGLESSPVGSMQKNGLGQLIISGNAEYLGTTTVAQGTLTLNGLFEKHYWNGVGMVREPAATTSVSSGAKLNGTGVTTGPIAGAGTYEPGTSAGILTAASLNPTNGTDFAFEIGSANPNYGSATSSANDVLRLTGSSTPFASALGASNDVSLYLNLASVSLGDTFTGGFFTDLSSDFSGSISNANFAYFILGDGNGTARTYNGVGYYSLSSLLGLTMDVSTTATTAAFASGSVNGRVMTLSTVTVPEPSTIVSGLLCVLCVGVTAYRKRRGRSLVNA